MGCHTWFYRRCNQEELNDIKSTLVSNTLDNYSIWENIVNGNYHLIPLNSIEYVLYEGYDPNDLCDLSKYSELVYNSLYRYEYSDVIKYVEDILSERPEWITIEYDKLNKEEQEKLDLIVQSNFSWKDFKTFQNYLTTYYDISFNEYAVIRKRKYNEILKHIDMSNPIEWTEFDNNIISLIENCELDVSLVLSKGIVIINNGNIYTDKDMPGDVFRLRDYDAPRFTNRYELIDWVNNWKKENNEDPLSEEQIKQIHETFDKYNDDVVVEFG